MVEHKQMNKCNTLTGEEEEKMTTLIDAKKTLDQIHPLMMKTLSQLGVEGTFLTQSMQYMKKP